MRSFAVKYRRSTTVLFVDDQSEMEVGESWLAISPGVKGGGARSPSQCFDWRPWPWPTADAWRTLCISTLGFQKQSKVLSTEDRSLPAKLCVSACSWNGAFLEMRMCRHLSWSYTLTENLTTGSHMKVWNWTLIAGCTDPGHSWANPAKRGMSMPKLAFQNTALPTEDSEKQWWDAGHLRQSREWRSTQMSGAHLFHLYRLYWRAASPVSS